MKAIEPLDSVDLSAFEGNYVDTADAVHLLIALQREDRAKLNEIIHALNETTHAD